MDEISFTWEYGDLTSVSPVSAQEVKNDVGLYYSVVDIVISPDWAYTNTHKVKTTTHVEWETVV